MPSLRCAVGLMLIVGGLSCTHAASSSARRSAHEHDRTRSRRTTAGAGKAPCVAVYNDKCFGTADEACAFAGCADQRCDVIPTEPAQVSCDDMR